LRNERDVTRAPPAAVIDRRLRARQRACRGGTPPRRHGDRGSPPGRFSTLRAVEERLLAWFATHGRDLPWRRTRDPYAILVSEVMLQQTQVERVLPRYLAWLERWPTVEAVAAATAGDVIREWQG